MTNLVAWLRGLDLHGEYFFVLVAVFAAATLVVAAVGFVMTRRAELKRRLSRFAAPEAKPVKAGQKKLIDESPEGFVVRLAAPAQKMMAFSGDPGKSWMRRILVQAGLRSRRAHQWFLAAKLLTGLGAALGYVVFFAFYQRFSLQLAITAGIVCLAGFFLPDLVVWAMADSRKTKITRAFPDALDLMVVCAEAGLALDMTFKRVGEEIRPLCPSLSEEFAQTNMEIRAGRPRAESLKRMGERTGVGEVQSLMSLLAQANRFGTSIARTLRVHSDAMRVKRRQLAETKAAKLAVKLIFPLVMFIFPALFVVILGPAAIRVARVLLPALTGGTP